MALPLPSEAGPHSAHALLSRAHSPDTTNDIFTERVLRRPLILRAHSPQPSVRALRRRKRNDKKAQAKRKARGPGSEQAKPSGPQAQQNPAKTVKPPKRLSAREKRAMGLLELPKAEATWDIMAGLHNLWLGYVWEILGLTSMPEAGENEGEHAAKHAPGASKRRAGASFVTPDAAGPMLASADLHGALVEVVRCRCVSRVGLRGIVARDSKSALIVVTRTDEVKTVPKEHTVFRVEVPLPELDGCEAQHDAGDLPSRRPLLFDLVGDAFCNRAAERATKKFKMHYRPVL